jgi:CRISPR-associated protein Csm3
MNATFGHDRLHDRYRFKGMLILQSPLRLSSGRASDDTDAPLMRTGADLPYIPGSSLRGAIRSELERILAADAGAHGLTSCILFSDDDCNKKARQYQKEKERTDKELAQYAAAELCDVCKLFGSCIFASRLIVEDAYPIQNKELLKSKLIIRDGVGIDRDTGTASEGAKFDYEVMETGPTFTFRMQVENVTDKDRSLINIILTLLRQGIYLGGKRAAGLGKVTVGTTEVTGFENPQSLWDAIANGADPHRNLTWGKMANAKTKAL